MIIVLVVAALFVYVYIQLVGHNSEELSWQNSNVFLSWGP